MGPSVSAALVDKETEQSKRAQLAKTLAIKRKKGWSRKYVTDEIGSMSSVLLFHLEEVKSAYWPKSQRAVCRCSPPTCSFTDSMKSDGEWSGMEEADR